MIATPQGEPSAFGIEAKLFARQRLERDAAVGEDARRERLGLVGRAGLSRDRSAPALCALAPGSASSSSFSSAIWRSNSSRCDVTEMNSPAPIENAPASRPAMPVRTMKRPSGLAPATPMTRLRFESRPSLMPKMAARSVPPVSTRCQLLALRDAGDIAACSPPGEYIVRQRARVRAFVAGELRAGSSCAM